MTNGARVAAEKALKAAMRAGDVSPAAFRNLMLRFISHREAAKARCRAHLRLMRVHQSYTGADHGDGTRGAALVGMRRERRKAEAALDDWKDWNGAANAIDRYLKPQGVENGD